MQKHQETEEDGEHVQRPPVFSCYAQTGDHFTIRLNVLINNKTSVTTEMGEKMDACRLPTLHRCVVSCSSLYETDPSNVFASYKKTSETLSTAGHKTSAAFSTLSSTLSRKFEDMRYELFLCASQDAQSWFFPLLVT